MTRLLRIWVALVLGAFMGIAPAFATTEPSSLGIYQTHERDMDYELTLCGDGTQLCVRLLAARGKALTDKSKPYIGKLIVDRAKATGVDKWDGAVTVRGYTVYGSLTLDRGNRLYLHGCLYFVLCADLDLVAAKKK